MDRTLPGVVADGPGPLRMRIGCGRSGMGVGPDNHGLFIMPADEYSHFSDSDLGAFIAYLKTVPPVDRERVPTSLGPVSRVLLTIGKIKLAAEVIDHPNLRPGEVAPGVTVESGRYVANGCIGCHGTNFSGGKIEVGPPSWPLAANLTPHAARRDGAEPCDAAHVWADG